MSEFPPRVKWTYKYGLTYASFEDGNDEKTVYYISMQEALKLAEKLSANAVKYKTYFLVASGSAILIMVAAVVLQLLQLK